MEDQKKKMSETVQTTARIPRVLSKLVRKLCVDLDMDQTEAINHGLELWMSYQHADKYLRSQMDEAVKNWKNSQREEPIEPETTTKSPRRRTAG
jgi:hypothetical protein